MNYRKYLKAAYQIEGITSSKEKKRVREYVYRLAPDWDKAKLPSLAVAFGILSLTKQERYPGWIPMYQTMACALADRIKAHLERSNHA